VAKLKGARDRKRRSGVKVEGRKSISEERPETVEYARKLARARPKGGKRSLREISAALAEAGHMTNTGRPYAPTAVKLMLARPSRAVATLSAPGEAGGRREAACGGFTVPFLSPGPFFDRPATPDFEWPT
jgi:hypothetical protein